MKDHSFFDKILRQHGANKELLPPNHYKVSINLSGHVAEQLYLVFAMRPLLSGILCMQYIMQLTNITLNRIIWIKLIRNLQSLQCCYQH